MFEGKVPITIEKTRADVRLMPLAEVDEGRAAADEKVVAIGDAELAEIIPLMSKHAWFNHVVSPKLLDEKLWGTTLAGAIWELIRASSRPSAAAFFGTDFKGRQATIRSSERRGARMDTIADYARELGASSSLAERIRDVAEELVTNAIYDAPAEKKGEPADRTKPVRLSRDKACQLTYGAARQTFYLRVRDQYGTLKRKRLLSVLDRCAARTDVDFDTTSGGAGLGMWRIFSAASLILVRVTPGKHTDFLVGVDIQRGRRWQRGRAIHLFFQDPPPETPDSREVRS